MQPVRVDHWQLVDPLESLAGARPLDDVVVALRGSVAVRGEPDPALEIVRQPVQISGRYRGLVRFDGPPEERRGTSVTSIAGSRAFEGRARRCSFRSPSRTAAGRLPSTTHGLTTSELNAGGWYVYGSPGAERTVRRSVDVAAAHAAVDAAKHGAACRTPSATFTSKLGRRSARSPAPSRAAVRRRGVEGRRPCARDARLRRHRRSGRRELRRRVRSTSDTSRSASRKSSRTSFPASRSSISSSSKSTRTTATV